MGKETRTRNSVIGYFLNSIALASKSILNSNDNNDDISEIKYIDEYKSGELSEEEQDLVNRLKKEEYELKIKLERAQTSLRNQRTTGNRVTNLRMQIVEKSENENEK